MAVYNAHEMRISKLIVIAAILLIISLAAGGACLYTIYLPKRLYAISVTALAQATGRSVSLAKAEIQFPKGVVLKDIVVYEDDKKTEFLRIKELNCNVLLLPFFKEKKVIVPTINLLNPRLSLTRSKEGRWNFQTLAFLKEKGFATKGVSFLVYSVNFGGGFLSFKDEFAAPGAPAFERNLKALSGAVSIGLPNDVRYRCSFGIENSPTQMSVTGGYSFIRRVFYANCSAKELSPADFAIYYKDKLPFEIRSLAMNPSLKLACYSDGRSRAILTTDLNGLAISARGMKSPKEISANASGDFKIDVQFNLKDPLGYRKSKPTYSGEITLDSADVSGIRHIGAASGIKAKAYFNQEEIAIENLSCVVFENRLEASGKVSNYTKTPLFDLKVQSKELDLKKLAAAMSSMGFKIAQGAEISGRASASMKLRGELDALDYKGIVTIRDAALEKGQFRISSIGGQVAFEPNLIRAPKLSASFAGTPVTAALKVWDFSTFAYSLSAETQIALARVKDLLPPALGNKLADTEFEGDCAVTLNASGKFLPQFGCEIDGSAKLQDASISNPRLPDKISKVAGAITFTRHDAESRNLSLIYKGRPYSIAAQVQNFAAPEVKLSLESQDLYFDSQFSLKEDIVEIHKCAGAYKDIAFDFGGELANFDDPAFDVSGNASFTLQELLEFFPKYEEKLQKAKPTGNIACGFAATGRAKSPKDWVLRGRAKSAEINAYQLSLENFSSDFQIKAEKLEISRLVAGFYGGTIDLAALVDTSGEKLAFEVNGALLDADISRLKEITPFRDKNIYGYLTLKLLLSGTAGEPNTFNGGGWLRIRNGYLWESPIMGLLAGLAYLPSNARTVFTEASGTFEIKDERIYTHDLTLLSDQMRLVADGSVGFDKTLSFDIGMNISGGLAQIMSLTRLGEFLLTEGGELLMDLKLKGTLQDPKFTKKLSPEKLLKEKIFKQLPQIFEDIFQ